MLINAHASPIKILTIDGIQYKNVRGLKPFYLPIPSANAVVFVVDENDNSVTYHVYNMETKEDVAIHAKHSVFGNHIGSAKPDDSVELEKDGLLVLCNTSGPNVPRKTFIGLDLKRRIVVSQKSFFYDHDGKLIKQFEDSAPF